MKSADHLNAWVQSCPQCPIQLTWEPVSFAICHSAVRRSLSTEWGMLRWWCWSPRLPLCFSFGGRVYSLMCRSTAQMDTSLLAIVSSWPLLRPISGPSWQGHGLRVETQQQMHPECSCICRLEYCRGCSTASTPTNYTCQRLLRLFLRCLSGTVMVADHSGHTAVTSLHCQSKGVLADEPPIM